MKWDCGFPAEFTGSCSYEVKGHQGESPHGAYLGTWCFLGFVGPRRLTAAVVPAGFGRHLSGSNGLFYKQRGGSFQEKARGCL